ncbi:MAG: Hsp20/alpha crystallin family protein [Kiritimatiellae bacterium]|nr:Hsp20/alpha crystallin family protein [Kiritimatiellia bacterium]
MYYHSILKPQVEEEWAPNTDVYADKEGLVVKMEVAGVPRSAIDICYEKGQLTVAGIRNDPTLESEKTERRFTQAEIEYGHFKRVIKIDIPVEVTRASAQLQDGILYVRLPWAKEAEQQQITVTLDSE